MTNQVKMAPAKQAEKPVKKKKIASLDRRKARAGFLFALPFVLGFLLIYVQNDTLYPFNGPIGDSKTKGYAGENI